MRDVVTGFYCQVLRKLISTGKISATDSVLVVCGGPLDRAVMQEVGLSALVTNISHSGQSQDAENLTFMDGSFDIVIVHAGLHHCYSPHRALLEMYRVARKTIVVFESRDSLLMRVAVRAGLTLKYETDAIENGVGGVANTAIPNFVYRWTEREVAKTIASFDPAREPDISYFYDFRLPIQRFTRSGNRALRAIGLLIEPMSPLIAATFPSQCNEFAFVAGKTGKLHSWIAVSAETRAA